MSGAALVVVVPAFAPPGWSLHWRVGVRDCWVSPGTPLAVEPGATEVAIRVEAIAPKTSITATARLRVDVAPGGTTRVAIPARTIGHIFTPRQQ